MDNEDIKKVNVKTKNIAVNKDMLIEQRKNI